MLKLKDFLKIYNFREYIDNQNIPEFKRRDTSIIRIYLSDDEDDFIEFGVDDYCDNKKMLCEKFIKDDILKSNIATIKYDYDLNTLAVWLGDDS